MYLLDTNACIAVINGTSPALRTMIAEALGEGSVLCVSTVVLHELWFGAAKSARAAYNADRIQAFLAGPLEVLRAKYGDNQSAVGFKYSKRVRPAVVFKSK
mgnify:CR=1 FL=1